MKKIFVMAAAAAAMSAMMSCNGGGSASLKDGVDSLAYDLGVAQAQGLKQYMTMQLGVDTAYIDEFIKGMQEGAVNEADPKKDAYMQGMQVGKQVQQMAKGLGTEVYGDDSTKTVNVQALLAGLTQALKGNETMSADSAYARFNSRLEPIRTANIEKQYAENKAAGEKYLKDNKGAEGVTTLPSGIQYKVLVEGKGALPTDTTKLQVNYEGKLIDGTVFDSSYERNQPFTVDMANPRVIAGWVEILKLMPAGSKWEVTIPQDKAYGAQDMGNIKPFSTLIFTIEVL